MQDGTFVFGGVNGFNMFHPDSLADNIIEPRVTISRLKVWNNIIYAGDTIKGKLVLPCAIDHISCLELTHECNNLTFEFSSLVYNDPKHNKYKYRLSRIDKEWVETDGSSPQAVYSNLRSGKYTLTVYGSNEDGVWSETPAVMDIIITPPFYATHFAFVLYVLVILFSGYAFHRRSIRKVNERHQIEVERNRFIEEQKSSASMLQFYTDIAHELKTPISLIAAPVEELLMNHHLGATTRNRLSLVNKNIGALMNLIGQILDLRKYENQKMKLNATQVDLVPLLNDIAELFRPLATNQKINFIIDIPEEEVLIWIDRTKIETVVNNLLSNAFKYTNQGDVILSLVVDEVNAIITVKDDGIGIPKEDQSQIFDRFYQASNNKSIRKSVGIGLAKVKHIVDLHQGETKIESEVSVGSAFSIYLPINLNCPTSDQTVQMSDLELPILDATVSDNFEDTEITKPKESCVNQDKGVLILIAEDNVQLRTYLQTVLQPRYNTIVAEDGQVAYEMAVANSPDLILSDIVMPRMNGIDLCHCIKENKDTAHINVILLTAHDLQSNEIAGYKMGADGYISKPFSLEVLFAKIDALITKHDTMRQTLHMEIDAAMHEVTVENRDTQFLTKCINLVEANISDPQFNVQELGRLTGSSRSLLYRRIYSLTALTPVQFIREMRLKRAAQLLYQDSTLSVMEVMYSVGYTNPSHFSKIFYEKFGSNPKEFALKGKDYTGQ